LAELKKIKGLKVVSRNKNQVTIHIHGQLSPLFRLLAKSNVSGIDTRVLDLEEVFLRFYEDKEQVK
jgi:hypothetical protein